MQDKTKRPGDTDDLDVSLETVGTHLQSGIPPAPPVHVNVVQNSLWIGPVPAPQVLEHYERLVPGIAREFFNDVFQDSEHRRVLELRDNEQNQRLTDAWVYKTKVGVWLSGVLTSVGIICGMLALIVWNNPAASVAGFIPAFLAFVALLRRQHSEPK